MDLNINITDAQLGRSEYSIMLRSGGNPLPKSGKRADEYDYDAAIKAISADIKYIESHLNRVTVSSMANSLTVLKEIVGLAFVEGYNVSQQLNLYYALIQLTMITAEYYESMGDERAAGARYEDVINLLKNLNPGIDHITGNSYDPDSLSSRYPRPNTEVFNTDIKFKVHYPDWSILSFTRESLLADKQMWFVSLLLKLIERKKVTAGNYARVDDNGNSLQAVLNNTISRPNIGPVTKRFYENMRELVRLAMQPDYNFTTWRNLYQRVKEDDTAGMDSARHLLRLQVLNEWMARDSEPAQFLPEIAGFFGSSFSWDPLLKEDDRENVAQRTLEAAYEKWYDRANVSSRDRIEAEEIKPAHLSIALLQVTHNVYVQYFILRANYLKLSAAEGQGQLTAFKDFINSNSAIVQRLTATEGAYFPELLAQFAREVDFIECELLLTRVKRYELPANDSQLSAKIRALALNQSNLSPMERQRLYYIQTQQYLNLADFYKDRQEYSQEKAERESLLRLINGALPQSGRLPVIYETEKTGANNEFALNVRCGLAEWYVNAKDAARAAEAYASLKETAVYRKLFGAAASEDSPFNKTLTRFSEAETRLLFLAAQLEDNENLRHSILERLRALNPPAAAVNLSGRNFAYNAQRTRNYWNATAQLAFLGEDSCVAQIESEYKKPETVRMQDKFFIEKLYTDVYFLVVLKNLDDFKKQGKWQDGLQYIADNAVYFKGHETELDFQTAEVKGIGNAYADLPAPSTAGLDSTNANNRQRIYHLEASALARAKDYPALLQKIRDFNFIKWDGQRLTCQLDRDYTLTDADNEDRRKTAAEYNQEFSAVLVCGYLETLENILTKQLPVPNVAELPRNTEDLRRAFIAYFQPLGQPDRVAEILAKTTAWSDSELRILNLAAKYLPEQTAVICQQIRARKTDYPDLAEKYTPDPDQPDKFYYYNSGNWRAYWEASRGLIGYYAEHPAEYAQEPRNFEAVFTEIARAYARANGAQDSAYIRDMYFYALQTKCNLRLDNETPVGTELDILKSLLTVASGSAEKDPDELDEQQAVYYDLCSRNAQLVYSNDPQAAVNALAAVYKDVAGDLQLQSTTKNILLDALRLSLAVLLKDNKDKGVTLSEADARSISLPLQYVKGETAAAYLRAYDGLANHQKRLYLNVLLNLAKTTDGPVSGADGDDDPAETAVEMLLGLRAADLAEQGFAGLPADDPRRLAAAARAAQTSALVGARYFAQLEPRLRLDYGWALLNKKKVSDDEARLAETLAAKYHAEPKLKLEAEDMLRLAWYKRKDKTANQQAVNGGMVNSRAVPGYSSFVTANPDLTVKRIYDALDSLIVLYGYNKNTRDDLELTKLAAIIASQKNSAAGQKLYINVQLALAEMYYRQSATKNTLGALESTLRELSGLLNRAVDAEKYYTYCELQIRRVLRQYKDRPKSEAIAALLDLQRQFALTPAAADLADPAKTTEKLLADTLEINIRALQNAAQLTQAELTDDLDYLKFYQTKCATELQRTLFLNELLTLARVTNGPNVTYAGDDDEAEQAVRAILALPETASVLDEDYFAQVPYRLLLDFAWSILNRKDIKGVDVLDIAEKISLDDRRNLSEELQFEALSLQMLSFIKSSDIRDLPDGKVRRAVDWYEKQLADGAAEQVAATANSLLPVTYAYQLGEYAKALKFIDDLHQAELRAAGVAEPLPLSADTQNLDPVNFAIIVDCWNEQDPPQFISAELAQAYHAYTPQDTAEKIAVAAILSNYVEQQLQARKGPLTEEEKTYLDDIEKFTLPDDAQEAAYIKNKAAALRAQSDMYEKKYTGLAERLAAILKTPEITGPALDKEKYLANAVYRLLAQLKEAQGDYAGALAALENIKYDFIPVGPKKREAEIYDALQRAGVYLKQGETAAAQNEIAKLTPADLTAEQKEIYYSRCIALLSAEMSAARLVLARDKNDAAARGKLAESKAAIAKLRDNPDLAPANICEAELALLDPDAPAAVNLAAAAAQVNKLEPKQQADYTAMLEQLQAYAYAAGRDYKNLDELLYGRQDFPALDPDDGLVQEEHALTMQLIYLNTLIDTEAENAWGKISAAHTSAANALRDYSGNEGLTRLLQNYQAGLAKVRKAFLETHFKFNKEGEEINIVIDGVEFARAAKQLKDTPAYTVREQGLQKDFEPRENDFWDYKEDIDRLLDDTAAAAFTAAGITEIMQAVNTLYDLGLENEDLFPELAGYTEDNSQLLGHVNAFLAKKPDTFAFNSAEKGYGYLLLLRMLRGNADKPRFDRLLQEVEQRGYLQESNDLAGGYYPESSVQIIDYLTRLPKKADEYLATLTLPKVTFKTRDGGVVAARGKIGDALTDGDLDAAAAEAEKGLRLALGLPEDADLYAPANLALLQERLQTNPARLESISGIDDAAAKKQAEEDFTGYSEEIVFLELVSVSIRRLAERRFGRVLGSAGEQRALQLIDVLDSIDSPVNGDYFELRRALIKVQYGAAILPKRLNDEGWTADDLDGRIRDVADLLAERQQRASSAGEKRLLADLRAALAGEPVAVDKDKVPYALPDEARYLYAELSSRLPRAILTIAAARGNKLTRQEANTVRSLIEIHKILAPEDTSIKYTENDWRSQGKPWQLEVQFNYGWQRSGYESRWDYNVEVVDKDEDGNILSQRYYDVPGNNLTSQTDQHSAGLGLHLQLFPWKNGQLNIGANGSYQPTITDQSTAYQEISEGVKVPFSAADEQTGHLQNWNFNIGAQQAFLHNWSLNRRLTLTDLTGGLSLNYGLSQYQRSPLQAAQYGEHTAWQNSGAISAWLNNSFAPRGLEDVFNFGYALSGSYGLAERFEIDDAASTEKHYLRPNAAFNGLLTAGLNVDGWRLNGGLGYASRLDGEYYPGLGAQLGVGWGNHSFDAALSGTLDYFPGYQTQLGLNLTLRHLRSGLYFGVGVDFYDYPTIQQNKFSVNPEATSSTNTESNTLNNNVVGKIVFGWNF